jgi:DNA polymerase III subunit psi
MWLIIQLKTMNMLTTSQSNRRDWYLDQLGITQYKLRQPMLLNEKSTLAMTEATRLIIIKPDESTLPEPFFSDILQVMNLNDSALLFIKPDQASLLPTQVNCLIWSIGNDEFAGINLISTDLIQTPSLNSVIHSATDKRQLWQQLCQYEHYFRT